MSFDCRLFDRLPTPTLQWLWPHRIPRAGLTLIVGQPGIGKSLLAVDLAARLSAALPWPDDEPSQLETRNSNLETGNSKLETGNSKLETRPLETRNSKLETGDSKLETRPLETRNLKLETLFVRPEDDPASVLRPRLTAAGADLARISIADNSPDDPRPLVLPEYLYQLVPAVRAMNAPALVIFDPLTAVLPSGPAAANALSALIAFARRHNVAVIGITHLSKQSSPRPLYRVSGPISLLAAARAVYMVSADPDDRDRRLVSELKTVYGPPTASLAFRILPGPRLEWQPPSEPVLPHAAYVPPDLCDLPADAHSALAEACAWLADYLAAGPRPAAQLLRDGRAAGLSVRTLHRAKRLLAARSFKSAAADGWCWAADQHSRLPNQPLQFGNIGNVQPVTAQQ